MHKEIQMNANQLREGEIFKLRMGPLQEFSDRRADRVKDSSSITFFKDIQMVSETDTADDLKCEITKIQFPVRLVR